MHPTILATRRAKALDHILATAATLVKHLELDESLIADLQPVGIKDPRVTEMLRLEGLTVLFDQLADSAGVKPVTAVTPEPSEPDSEVEPPGDPSTDEAQDSPPEAGESVLGPDGLPAPTLDEVTSNEQTETDTAEGPQDSQPADEPIIEEAPEEIAEAVPAEVKEAAATVEEEPPAPKPTRKSTKKKTSRKGS